MNITQHRVRQAGSDYDAHKRSGDVSLPAPPRGITFDRLHAETEPRVPPIRGARDWKRDAVLRHADKRGDRG